jgi:hypothetical protein
MVQSNLTYDTDYNRRLKSILDEMDQKHWNNGSSQYHPSMLGFKLSNFHGDYSGEPSARMMVGGGSHGDQMFVPPGNSPAYPPYMMHSGLLVNSGGARIGIDGAVGGKYGFSDFVGDVAHVGKQVAPDLIRASLARGAGRKKGGASKVAQQIGNIAKTLAPFAPLLLAAGRPAPKSKADVVDALKDLGAKKSHSLKKLKELAMSGGYSFGDFVGDVAHVGKQVAPDLIRASLKKGGYSAKDFGRDLGKTALDVGKQLLVAKLQGGRKKKGGYSAKDFGRDLGKTALDVGKQLLVAKLQGGRKKKATGGINLKDVLDSSVPIVKSVSEMVKSADPAVKSQVEQVAKKVASKVKSAVGMGRGASARTAIVKKVMKDRGVSMIQASKIVKEEGLYKGKK